MAIRADAAMRPPFLFIQNKTTPMKIGVVFMSTKLLSSRTNSTLN